MLYNSITAKNAQIWWFDPAQMHKSFEASWDPGKLGAVDGMKLVWFMHVQQVLIVLGSVCSPMQDSEKLCSSRKHRAKLGQ